MSFSDLLSSGRGPGVIGTLIALVVLGGFGTLYLFVFDEGLQGGQKKIEAVIRDQGIEIESHKSQIDQLRKRLEKVADLRKVSEEADALKVRVDSAAQRVTELAATKETAAAAIVSARAAWEAYKDEYRAAEWAAAVGTGLPDITLTDGTVFTDVKISKVDHKGIAITHSGGSRTIKAEELPAEVFDRFQFDLEKKDEMVRKEADEFDDHSDNVEIATLAKTRRAKLERLQELQEETADLRNKIDSARRGESSQVAAISRQRSAVAAEKRKGSGISRAPAMEEQLRTMERKLEQVRASIPANEGKVRANESEAATLEAEVAKLTADIARVVKELEGKKAEQP
jgi:hypothetical protein